MGKALGCGLAGIVGIVIWIITVLIFVFMFFIEFANSVTPNAFDTGGTDGLTFAGVLIGGFILGLIPIILGIILASKEGNKDSKRPSTLICGKCNNKSTDFDGLFCPNCGEKFSTKPKDDDQFTLF